ncbi:hypothetical protein C0995_003972 [Termitomyces sp. Mi166|nr:hypothetical protein C0995_003972 [Termitomyces sp. Mi166\
MSNQDELTENLWFLSKLSRSNPPDYDIHSTDEPTEHSSTLRVLDAVAIYLTTGQSDGVIACFYQIEASTLIFAKSGCVNAEDRSAVTSFLKEIHAAEKWIDLLPFLAQRSAHQVNKKIRKLRTSFLECFDHLRRLAERHYMPSSYEPEFHGRWYRAFLKANKLDATELAEVPQALVRVLESCRDYLTNNQEFANTPDACADFSRLLYATRTLFDTPFFSIYGPFKLKRHLAKVTQYLDIARVIKSYKKLRRREIGVEWIEDDGRRAVERILDTATVGNGFKKAFVEGADMENEAKDIMLSTMDSKFPGWRGDEKGSLQVTLSVHPEIRLYLELVKRNIAQTRDIVMNFITNLNYGKRRCDWLYPDLKPFTRANDHIGTCLDSHVRTEVEREIKDVLEREQWEAHNVYSDRNMDYNI